MAVHLPIALVMVWPLVDAAGLALGKSDVSWVGVALLVAAVPTALFATVTGQAAYDAGIAAGFSAEMLDAHAQDADLVPWLLLVVLVVRTAGVKKLGRPAHLVALIAGLGLAGFLYVVGSSGGDLVYTHRVGVEAAR